MHSFLGHKCVCFVSTMKFVEPLVTTAGIRVNNLRVYPFISEIHVILAVICR